MSKSAEDILAKELGKLTGLSSAVGHVFSGDIGFTGVAGAGVTGFLGVKLAERFLPTERYTEKLVVKVPPDKALKRGFSVLAKIGALQQDGEEAPYPFLKAVLRSGFLGMNPAVIYFEILEGDASKCEVVITGAAKEGLIKQQTAQKAVQNVVAEFRRLVT